MKPKQCKECLAYLSEDEVSWYCDCGYEEFKTIREVWRFDE